MRTLLIILCFVTFTGAGSFERAMTFVLAHEGGYCHDGGWESNYGLCSKWYPKLNMKTLTQEKAIAIYKNDYWYYMGCVSQPDSDFALLIFDTAVLFGQPTANIMLKKCYFDINTFMYFRIEEIASIIKQYPDKIKYLATWMKRTNDLQKLMGGCNGSH